MERQKKGQGESSDHKVGGFATPLMAKWEKYTKETYYYKAGGGD